ncbi:MAG: hypothetical protein HZA02_07130 [Nitrospinae bacterium]|nr:hypothetical protein [Nitrospinota bacterium]
MIGGKLLAADEKTVVFKTAEGLLAKSREEVRAIFLGEPQAAAGSLPPGLSAANGLEIKRWTTFRRITNFQRGPGAKFVYEVKISADGSKIVFASYQGTFVVNADGSGLVQLSDKRNNGLVDISADAKKIAWYSPEDGLMVANSDGSARMKVPGGLKVDSLRMTAKGDRLFVLVPEQGGIYALPSDGSGLRRVVHISAAAKVAGTDENNNYWRGWPAGLDISDDGSRLAFTFLYDAFTANGDGGGLRKLTEFGKAQDLSLSRVRISGDGRRVVYHNARGDQSALTVMDWDGGNRFEYKGNNVNNGDWIRFSHDARAIVMSWGLRLFDGDGKGQWNADDLGGANPGPHALVRAKMGSIGADLKRAVLEIEGPESVDQGRPSQLVVAEFNPPSLNGLGPLENIEAAPRFMLNDGSNSSIVSARVNEADLLYAGVLLMREGFRLNDWLSWHLPLKKDPKAKVGVFSSEPVAMRSYSGKPMAAGPVTLRVFTIGKNGNVLTVDLEGLEARQP